MSQRVGTSVKTGILMFAALLVVIGLVVVAEWIPLQSDIVCRCPWCGAESTRTRILFVSVRESQREGALARYWRTNVDLRHEHEWVWLCGYENYIIGRRHVSYVGGGHLRWLLRDDCILAVMQGLPSTKERKQFMEAIWRSGRDVSRNEYHEIENTVFQVRNAYYENRARKDWMQILKRLGVFEYKKPQSNSTGKEGA